MMRRNYCQALLLITFVHDDSVKIKKELLTYTSFQCQTSVVLSPEKVAMSMPASGEIMELIPLPVAIRHTNAIQRGCGAKQHHEALRSKSSFHAFYLGNLFVGKVL